MIKFFSRNKSRSVGDSRDPPNGDKLRSEVSTESSSDSSGSLRSDTQLDQEKQVCEDNKGKVFTKPEDNIVLAPYNYIAGLPSKNVREIFIQGIHIWIQVPQPALESIKSITSILHQSSLMFDDIEDESQLRRGKPATHMLYGPAQTINSAVYALVNTFSEVHNLNSSKATEIFIDELQNLHCGQSFDLYWKYHGHIPTVEEYMMMVDHKTGGLFRLCVRLMQAKSVSSGPHLDLTNFIRLLGRFFQIRDDYQNLMSAEYSNQKGFCEDLDEAKISLPLIYHMQVSGLESNQVKGLLFSRRPSGERLPLGMKEFILEAMKANGAIEKTKALLQKMHNDLLTEFHQLEAGFGLKNAILEGILQKLKI
ncbi:Trans-Isoprenyl Diphosphate Synthases head-to-tail [Aspergillus parasiticus SU-1]|uniref:Isoprenoid synthase domain-containing protein n=2 Tax=Aspergillus parasiticus TaxID=5067 RepID=A0A5N6DWM6_ASPPA|nr:isoprenoid synthase domain-containing protein [Aspergillus parasiticus]KJK66284.1 Trans-Isoprenyl Diphosphate Synthases head-to-tail [Aspergillus parasiticus SU-1]